MALPFLAERLGGSAPSPCPFAAWIEVSYTFRLFGQNKDPYMWVAAKDDFMKVEQIIQSKSFLIR